MSTITIHGKKNLITVIADVISDKLTSPPTQEIEAQRRPPCRFFRKGKVMGVVLPRPINSVKVVRIKRQLQNGSYDLDERLDAVLDDVLKDINA